MSAAPIDDVGTFDPQFDADTGWAFARARRAEVIARWRNEGKTCLIGRCDHRAIDRLCAHHLKNVDRRRVPVIDRDGERFCALCGQHVMVLYRNDQPRTIPWVLEASGHPQGLCLVEEGGFTVLNEDKAHRHRSWTEAAPLFRTHPVNCPEVVRLRATGTLGWDDGD